MGGRETELGKISIGAIPDFIQKGQEERALKGDQRGDADITERIGRGYGNREATEGGNRQLRKGRGYRNSDATEGGGSPTKQRGRAEPTGIKRPQRGRIADNTERKGGGYRSQEATEKGGSSTVQFGMAEAKK